MDGGLKPLLRLAGTPGPGPAAELAQPLESNSPRGSFVTGNVVPINQGVPWGTWPSLFVSLMVCVLNFIYFHLCCVFIAARDFSCSAQALLSRRADSRGGDFSRCRARALGHTGSVVVAPGLQSTASITGAHGLSCSKACGILLDQGSNPCLLHSQADSLPLSHQGSLWPSLYRVSLWE